MFRQQRSPLAAALALVLLTGGTVAGGTAHAPLAPGSALEFLDRHWRRPIEPQGSPPTGFSPLETSLAPQSCGTCHPAQLSEWKTTLHATSMGPGLTGQLAELWRTEPESARLCLTCHAPLAEQQPENRAIFDAALQGQGSPVPPATFGDISASAPRPANSPRPARPRRGDFRMVRRGLRRSWRPSSARAAISSTAMASR